MQEYLFKISMCDGKFCNGIIPIMAESEDEANETISSYIGEKLFSALPELDIEYSWELVTTEKYDEDPKKLNDDEYYELCLEKSKECLIKLLSRIEGPLGIELAGILAETVFKIEDLEANRN